MKISRRWLKIAEVYKIFSDTDIKNIDFSTKAKEELYLFESKGVGNINDGSSVFSETEKINGYALGKRWMDITVAMWKEDVEKGTLFLSELYKDKFPHWWLNNIFNRKKAVVC